jgi:hypothetical protein
LSRRLTPKKANLRLRLIVGNHDDIFEVIELFFLLKEFMR